MSHDPPRVGDGERRGDRESPGAQEGSDADANEDERAASTTARETSEEMSTTSPAESDEEASPAISTESDAESTTDGTAPAETAVPEIDEGRYVYCVVRVDDGQADALESPGVDDEPVSVVDADGIAAVVHDCDRVYDSADPVEIRRWLVRHQSVVDAAGEAFGTPLPFQFDTIIRGDDAVVRDWLQQERESLERALAALADHWEYRIELVRTEPIDEDQLVAADDSLAALREKIDAADRGRAHLLEKRFESRLRERRRERRDRLARQLREHVSPHVRELHELEREPSAGIELDGEHDDGTDVTTICRLTVLAHEDDEAGLGDALDEIAVRDGIEIRFTGPWPPYTFTPAFGDDGDQEE